MIRPTETDGGHSNLSPEFKAKVLAVLAEVAPGDKVIYAGSEWEVACIKQFGHGPMIGIYDEPPGKHIDYLNPGSVKLIAAK